MSYLGSIVARAAGAEPVLQPRALSRFESHAEALAPMEENATETLAPAPRARVETQQPMIDREAPRAVAAIAHTIERVAPVADEAHAAPHERQPSPPIAPAPIASSEHEHTQPQVRESRIETQQHHHHHHTARETHSRETNTVVAAAPQESSEPPLRALLHPQSPRVIEPLTRERTTLLRESQTPQAPPSIRVTIGRVDVRAITPSPQTTKAAAPRPKPFTLDDYVRLRDGERR
jgi:hypothetical protein